MRHSSLFAVPILAVALLLAGGAHAKAPEDKRTPCEAMLELSQWVGLIMRPAPTELNALTTRACGMRA